jgi:hypothetical protein
MKLPNFRRSRVVPILAATVLVAGVPAGSANPRGSTVSFPPVGIPWPSSATPPSGRWW